MKTLYAVFAIVLAAGAAVAAPGPARDAVPTGVAQSQWLTIPGIYDTLTAAGYRNIDEIERERNGYKVKATDPSGARVKLYVDPVTGEVLNVRGKSGKSDRRGVNAPAPAGQQGGDEGSRYGDGRRGTPPAGVRMAGGASRLSRSEQPGRSRER